MAKVLNTWLLAAAAIAFVAIGAAVIVMAGMIGDDGDDTPASAAAGSGEQEVYLINLGMT